MKRILVAMALMAASLVVAAGVAWALTVNCQVGGGTCEGTDEPDELIGTNTPDFMNAKQDDDRLLGRGGRDDMFGDDLGPEDTRTDGDDEVFGNDGNDAMNGFGGSDLLRGGGNADSIDATEASENPGKDTVWGDGGRDFILANDGVKDTIDCGEDEDTVLFDEKRDVVADNCENQNPPNLTDQAAQAQVELASLPGR
jgi:Ca2+-binding RTX toxin-like protein